MFVVIIRWFANNVSDTVCVVTETEEKAQEWIDKEMKDKEYSGMGVHKIIPVNLYQ